VSASHAKLIVNSPIEEQKQHESDRRSSGNLSATDDVIDSTPVDLMHVHDNN